MCIRDRQATTFDELFDGCYNIAWEELLPANAAFPVKGSSLSSQLSSVPACQKMCIRDRARTVRKSRKTAKKSRKTQNSAEKQLQKPSIILYN